MANANGPQIRWGVLGTGGIATTFVTDLARLPDACVTAVGSRAQDSADRFARRFGIDRAYASYEQLVADPEVDAIYVATPHPMHRAGALLAIEAGKACLVEKPIAISAEQTREMVDAARRRGTFLMEAMWTRFLPHIVRVRELVEQGRLGDIRSVLADFGERFEHDPRHRAYAPELGGGALLDLGVYPVSFASMLLGTPSRIVAVSNPASTGVDAQTSVVLQYASGAHAVLFTSIEARTPNRASVNGTVARIEIEGDFFAPATLHLVPFTGRTETFALHHEGRGLRHQAAEVARCLRAGLTESPVLPLDESVSIMQTLDEIRRQIGLVYPGE